MNYLGIILSLALLGAVNAANMTVFVSTVVDDGTTDSSTVDPLVSTPDSSTVDPSVSTTETSTVDPTVSTTDSSTVDPSVSTTNSSTVDPSVSTTDSSTVDPPVSTTNSSTVDPTISTTDSSTVDPSISTTDSSVVVEVVALLTPTQLLYNSAIDKVFIDTDALLVPTNYRFRFNNIGTMVMDDWGTLIRTDDVIVERREQRKQYVTAVFSIGLLDLVHEDDSNSFVNFNMTGLLTLSLKESRIPYDYDVVVKRFIVYVPNASDILTSDDIQLSPLALEIEIASEIQNIGDEIKSAFKKVAKLSKTGGYFAPAVDALKKISRPQKTPPSSGV